MRPPITLGITDMPSAFPAYDHWDQWQFDGQSRHIVPIPIEGESGDAKQADVYIYCGDAEGKEVRANCRPLIYCCSSVGSSANGNTSLVVRSADRVFFHRREDAERYQELFPHRRIEWLRHGPTGQINVLSDRIDDLADGELSALEGESVIVWTGPTNGGPPDEESRAGVRPTWVSVSRSQSDLAELFWELFWADNLLTYEHARDLVAKVKLIAVSSGPERTCWKLTAPERRYRHLPTHNPRATRVADAIRALANGSG